jgi:hypothetical protein
MKKDYGYKIVSCQKNKVLPELSGPVFVLYLLYFLSINNTLYINFMLRYIMLEIAAKNLK